MSVRRPDGSLSPVSDTEQPTIPVIWGAGRARHPDRR
jgi:hypothetical protein